ncbi:MAG: arsC [Candidatus Angelobacter sp.]|nr:arsC [Candidatus Angelobacter sp.]
MKPTVLFVCKDNSALSPIAAAVLMKLGSHSFEAYSAGIHPLFIEPLAVEVMAEIGVDLSQHRPRSVREFISTPINHLIFISSSETDEEPSFAVAFPSSTWIVEEPCPKIDSFESRLESFRRKRNLLSARIHSQFVLRGGAEPGPATIWHREQKMTQH